MTRKHTLASRIFLEENHDNCTICHRPFRSEETTHLGKSWKNKLIYVGNCCAENLKETIVRHVFLKRVYKVPEKDTIIWRFMDFTKFVSLVSSSTLFFSRADQFDDPFEGAIGTKSNKKGWDKYYLSFFEYIQRNLPDGYQVTSSDAEIQVQSKKLLSDLEKGNSQKMKSTFINCWHENQFESEAMWKLYTKNMSESIAVQTTYDRLHRSLKRNPDIKIGKVNYIDYDKNYASINGLFWFKRNSFEHEREVRAIYVSRNHQALTGLPFEVDLRLLIKNIYISPTAEKWFVNIVAEVLKTYGIRKRLMTSNMVKEPF